jgi:hypothetical protein
LPNSFGQLAKTQRVLVGTRRNRGRGPGDDPTNPGPLLKALGARPEQVLELAVDPDVERAIAEYAMSRLTDRRTDCPFQWHPDLAGVAAEAIGRAADGVFRLADDWCRLLCREPDALNPTTLAFHKLLHEGSAGVFRAPAPIALPTQASLVQDDPDRVGADEGQAIRGATQSALQRGQRPRGGAIALAVRLSVELGQDALLGRRVVQHRWPASVAWLERHQTLPIHARG